jgi:hypothetical protein
VKQAAWIAEKDGYSEDQIRCSIIHYLGLKYHFQIQWGSGLSILEHAELYPVVDYPDGGKVVDDEYIAVSGMVGWIRDCYAQHPRCNYDISGQDRKGKILVIDVEDECLREETLSTSYLVLSYVWGGFGAFQLTKANFEDLQVPGFLSPELSGLPKTIRDAMILTAKLGWRYLWGGYPLHSSR